MKQIAAAVLALALPLSAAAQVENYAVDAVHSYPHFGIDHFGLTMIWGRFDKMSGRFSIDRAAKKASVELTIETASLSTGDSERGTRQRTRDEHLRAADFFNVAEFPRMTYRSTNVKFAGENPSEIEGELTLLGVTKPVTLKLDRFTCKEHPFAKRPACGGNASGSLKRSEFGMKTFIPAVGDEIRLMINFEGMRQ